MMEEFLKKIFTQKDIDNLISSNAEESTHLEFKRGDALNKDDKTKNEIAKDISAFANSDGGILIYGIEETDHKASKLSFIDGNDFDKERL
ncbi:MAG: ATP-binding protein, partial [Bacteroidota bacterium]